MKNSSPYVVVFTLWLLVFSSASQTMIISPILPQIGDDLDIADAWEPGGLPRAIHTRVSVNAAQIKSPRCWCAQTRRS